MKAKGVQEEVVLPKSRDAKLLVSRAVRQLWRAR